MNINWHDNNDVARIVDACVKGDNMSQQILFKTFYGKMLAVCMRYSKDKEEANDIVQEGFIKVFKKLKKFEKKGSLEGWIRRIMINTALDFIRKRKDFVYDDEKDISIENLSNDPFDDQDFKDIVNLKTEVIINLLQQLSPAYRTVFNLYVIENMTHQEIAEYLNISVGTSKSNLAKAKQKLKKMVDNYIKQHYHEIL